MKCFQNSCCDNSDAIDVNSKYDRFRNKLRKVVCIIKKINKTKNTLQEKHTYADIEHKDLITKH